VSHPRLTDVWGARDPIDAWNKANASWVGAEATGDVLVVRYEDVIADIGRELDRFTRASPTRRRQPNPRRYRVARGPRMEDGRARGS